MQLPLTEPRALSDAAQILDNLEVYAERPSLIELARLVARSREGLALRQAHREPQAGSGTP
ncbi:hypothetical protein [Pseudoroseicyclus sp. CXY001]|uniref:hypothetical protein n=1 Tax=Pseudoroseicyclus sp. CXY001 TaxID=3242492 RepID=UPI0035709EFB